MAVLKGEGQPRQHELGLRMVMGQRGSKAWWHLSSSQHRVSQELRASGDPKEIRSEIINLPCQKGTRPWQGHCWALGGHREVPAYPVTLCLSSLQGEGGSRGDRGEPGEKGRDGAPVSPALFPCPALSPAPAWH